MHGGGGFGAKWLRRTAAAAALWLPGCALMPAELNLTPLWFHRLDEDGKLLEFDALWPIVHYERTVAGLDDFRIRPLYRRIAEPESEAEVNKGLVEHQFLWPLGRVRSDADESSNRLFPLWTWHSRLDQNGERDVDWSALFPLIWGGANERGSEDYFAFLPFFADIPEFLSYDRFRTFLFPFYVSLDKEGHHHTLLLWPLIGFSNCAEGGHSWFRILPFYGHDIDPGRHERRFVLWPICSWGFENEDAVDPVATFMIWPFFGIKTGRKSGGLTVLWPVFEQDWFEKSAPDRPTARSYKLNVLWPIFHWYESTLEDDLTQWWVWPFVGNAHSNDQNGWSFLWPLIWWRRYDDPDVKTAQEWVLPLFWHVRQEHEDGTTDDFAKLWPFVHRSVHREADGRRTGGDWSLLSPIPWRDGNAVGFEENYGFLWELAVGRQRAENDRSLDVLGRVFTQRTRGEHTTMSVPFLFNYESGGGSATLRLFQFLPIGLGSTAPEPAQ